MKLARLFIVAAFLIGQTVQAAPVTPAKPPLKFQFHMVNVGQVIQLVYAEALKQPYVINPDVLNDQRSVSFRYEAQNGDIRLFMTNFLDSLGLAIETKNGVDYIGKKLLQEKTEQQPELETFVYRPKHRDVGYISRVLAPLFKGQFAANKAIAAPEGAKLSKQVPEGSAASLIDQTADVLLFSGSAKEVATLQKLLPQIDDSKGQVMVRGVVYEVSSSDKDGSAFGLVLNLLGSRVSVVGGAASSLDNFVRLRTGSIDAVFSALSADSRFKVMSKASLRVGSGNTGHFSAGQDVPVLGAVSYPTSGGAPVQDIQYKPSGMIFDLRPVVRDDVVDLDVTQQISNFVKTETGVNNSPTLIKREVKTSLSLQDGDVVVLGGLAEEKETGSRSGLSFVPAFLQSRGSENSKSEILLVLQLRKL